MSIVNDITIENEVNDTNIAVDDIATKVEVLMKIINLINDPKIKWLKNKEVVQYLMRDFSFLPEIIDPKSKTAFGEKRKLQEDIWGRNLTGKKKDWSGPFGEQIAMELLIIMGGNPRKPKKVDNMQLDLETDDLIVEVKTKTYFTTGTASEKNGNVPFKYADLIDKFNKPLKILLIAGAESEGRDKHYIGGTTTGPRQKDMIQYWFNTKIQFIPFTVLLETVLLRKDDIYKLYETIL